jgi:hypothetical protein
MRFTLGFHQHEIAEEHHAVTPDGARYFGVLCLRSPYGEYTDMLGLRNSRDKSLPLGIAASGANIPFVPSVNCLCWLISSNR